MAREKKIDMVILGLLSHEDLSGYDIKKRIDSMISFFWKGSFGNIYPALKDMEEAGLVNRISESDSGREKIIYKITDKGSESLKDWLKDEQAVNEIRYETLLKLFFGGALDKAVSLANIEQFENKVKGDLRLLKGYCENLKEHLDNDDHMYYYLTASFGVETYEAYLKWCMKAKKILKNGVV
ncbi:MAG: PadR family transcriptional regulator [Lachnospiraceae bacterium]|nr:PadR family transcriptional regulator [Lachnospiraceae bacterium]